MKFQMMMKLKSHSSSRQQGIAILFAIVAMGLLMSIAHEISYDVTVEYVVNSQAVNRLKAYYAAKSGVELSLLRIKMFQKIASNPNLKMVAPSQATLIWSLPFGWPLPVPSKMTSVDQEIIKAKIKESFMDASFQTLITNEGSKIDVNDLGSESKALRNVTKRLLMGIVEQKILADPEWARRNQNLRYEEAINNMADWVDRDTKAQDGGDESRNYSSSELPPNHAFISLGEIHQVAGMTNELFSLLEPNLTLYGAKALNPNHASKEILMAIDPSFTAIVADALLERRANENLGGEFKDSTDFWKAAAGAGANVSKQVSDTTPLVFNDVDNFRILSIGNSSGTSNQKQITAITYNFAQVTQRLAENVRKELVEAQGQNSSSNNSNANSANNGNTPANSAANPSDPANSGGTSGGANQTSAQASLPKGPPRIVEWTER